MKIVNNVKRLHWKLTYLLYNGNSIIFPIFTLHNFIDELLILSLQAIEHKILQQLCIHVHFRHLSPNYYLSIPAQCRNSHVPELHPTTNWPPVIKPTWNPGLQYLQLATYLGDGNQAINISDWITSFVGTKKLWLG